VPGHDVVLIGASAGGIAALRHLLAGLPARLPASVLIVVHTPPTSTGRLPDILARYGPLPAAHAVPGQRLTPGLLTIAPPQHHLILTAGDVLRLHHGPTVHRNRPAIDPLLHSAARVCGHRAIAVILSGQLRDGADGAAAVAAAGGKVLVQDPADARYPSMPLATLGQVPAATAWPAAKLGPAIADLLHPPAPHPSHGNAPRAPVPVDGIDDALWTAVSQLHAYAAAQQRFQQRLDQASQLAAQSRVRAAHALHAAQLITDHVLPIFQPTTPQHPPTTGTHPPAALERTSVEVATTSGIEEQAWTG
jgi:two-component system, chemotaxis family, protein-glutamate methylesterase/glutaminase